METEGGSGGGSSQPQPTTRDVRLTERATRESWDLPCWHQSRIVPPRQDLRRLASVQAVTRLSRLYLPAGTIPPFPLHGLDR